ncbi:hypothetical protein KSP40_PGU021717 [Platanthera guangdongensis]|uniref:MORF/ORRM1/DAG-like MORF domain-containing protein n=1 Tax=Platanthera guangdongensis TaxID=2320717 RepID=A0ABR2LIJ4_9ASPA
MALVVRLRRAVLLSSSILKDRSFFPVTSYSSHATISKSFCPTATCLANPSLRSPLQTQSSSFHSSLSRFVGRYDREPGSKIPEDEILFEGCDYNHWLITMDFPKDPKPSPEEMVETYVQTLAKVVGSVEEAKKRMYACSTTTYTGFQAVMSEETSEKFRGLPGVVFILPDSYIDPVNKEYGGDKYENGVITHRPPPIQYGRQGRYGDGNRRRYDQPRYERQRPPGNQPTEYQSQGPPGQDGRNYAPQQNQGPPGQDGRSYGPPGQDGRSYGPPGQDGRSYGPPGQGGRSYGPPGQGGSSYGPPGQGGSSYGPPGQGGSSYGPPGQGGSSYGPPGQGGSSYGPPGQGGSSYGPPGQGGSSYGPPGQGGSSYGPPGQDGRSYGPPGHDRGSFGPPVQDGQSYGPPGSSAPQLQQGNGRTYGPPQGHNPQNMEQGYGRNYGPPQNYYGGPPPVQEGSGYARPQTDGQRGYYGNPQGQQQRGYPQTQPDSSADGGGSIVQQRNYDPKGDQKVE